MLIQLSNGGHALIDDEDFELVDGHVWYTVTKGYVASKINGRTTRLHRLILGLFPDDKLQADHINHNKLDNRKSNLRACTNAQNCANRLRRRDNVSGYKGVRWNVPAKKWQARIQCEGRSYHLGIFDKIEDAVMAYNTKAQELFGEFAYIDNV